jgi:hypothetical protein
MARKFLKLKKVSQKWLKKGDKIKIFAVLTSQAQGLSHETPTAFVE